MINIKSKLFELSFNAIIGLIICLTFGMTIGLISYLVAPNVFIAILFILFLSFVLYPYAYQAFQYMRWTQNDIDVLDPNKFYD